MPACVTSQVRCCWCCTPFKTSSVISQAAKLGITLLAAVSAPTALAIQLAEQTGLTLIGFARTQQHVVYANPQRLNA